MFVMAEGLGTREDTVALNRVSRTNLKCSSGTCAAQHTTRPAPTVQQSEALTPLIVAAWIKYFEVCALRT